MGEFDRFVPGPLSPLIVLDFTLALAGPYCTMLLASYCLEMAWHVVFLCLWVNPALFG